MPTLPHFEVDRDGLAKLLARRGKSFAITELIQNAWDQNVTTVNVTLERIPGTAFVRIRVEDDDPEGFTDLAHAYTLFAESEKKSNPEQRGRFNIGEKLVIALCRRATITTTKGRVHFSEHGRQHFKARRERGSVFEGELRMNSQEVNETERLVHSLIPPRTMQTFYNGRLLDSGRPLASFSATLATEISDDEGYLRPTRRMTLIAVYLPAHGDEGAIYEMGIPVVTTGDRFHVNVMQKVPLNTDRDNVTPAYLRDVRALVLNHMAVHLSSTEASEKWVDDALADDLVEPATVERVLDLRYGEKRVVYDPSDHEANRIAASQGYTVIPGTSFGKEAWGNIRAAGAVRPAGQVTPSPKPFADDGPPLVVVAPSDYTDEHRALIAYVSTFARETVGYVPKIVLASDPSWGFVGSFGNRELVLNLPRISGWNMPPSLPLDNTLIHELAHDGGAGHLTDEFDKALSLIGAKAVAAVRAGRL